jgi:septum formation inhibitor MinC
MLIKQSTCGADVLKLNIIFQKEDNLWVTLRKIPLFSGHIQTFSLIKVLSLTTSLSATPYLLWIMGHWQNSNIDVLLSIFDKLEKSDLLTCTYSCWTWNMAGNIRLYQKVQPDSLNKFQKLIRTISEPSTGQRNTSIIVQHFRHLIKDGTLKFHNGLMNISDNPFAMLSRRNIEQQNTESDTSLNMRRPQQLGQLIKNVTLKSLAYNDISGYPLLLMIFARSSPNIQTADIDYLQIYFASDFTPRLDWEQHIGSNWRQLQNLTLRTYECYKCSIPPLSSLKSILHHLHKLNTLEWTDFLYQLPHPAPNMINLQSLKVDISDKSSYENLKELLQGCRSTLRSLSIRWCITATTDHAPLDLEGLIKGLPKLKDFALTYSYEHLFTISSFGDQLETLTLISSLVEGDGQVHEIVGNAVSKTSNLKRFEIRYCKHIGKYMHGIIDNNKSTLQSIFIASRNATEVVSNLKVNNTRATNITTLGFHFIQNNLQLLELAKIFPQVEWLSLPDFSFSGSKGWINSESMIQFRHLKGIDWRTFGQLIDQYRFSYMKVQADWWHQF